MTLTTGQGDPLYFEWMCLIIDYICAKSYWSKCYSHWEMDNLVFLTLFGQLMWPLVKVTKPIEFWSTLSQYIIVSVYLPLHWNIFHLRWDQARSIFIYYTKKVHLSTPIVWLKTNFPVGKAILILLYSHFGLILSIFQFLNNSSWVDLVKWTFHIRQNKEKMCISPMVTLTFVQGHLVWYGWKGIVTT